jgi:hypothetical protein
MVKDNADKKDIEDKTMLTASAQYHQPVIRQRSPLDKLAKSPLLLYSLFIGVSLMLLGAVTAASLMV